MLCIDFVLFLKDQILKEFQNIEKKNINITKAMHSYVSNNGFNYNTSKKLELIKKSFTCFAMHVSKE